MAQPRTRGLELKTGVECEFFLISPDGTAISDPADTAEQAVLRSAGADAPLRRDHRNLRRDGEPGLEALSERPRRCERPVRDELAIRQRAAHRRSARLLQVHGEVDRRKARITCDLHAQAVRQPHRQRLPHARIAVEGHPECLRRSQGRAGHVGGGLSFHRRRHAFGGSLVRDYQPGGEFISSASTRHAPSPARRGRPIPSPSPATTART